MQESYIVNIISRVNAGLSLPLRRSLFFARSHTCTGLAFDLPRSFERANLHSSRGLMSCNSACTCAGRRTLVRARECTRTRTRTHTKCTVRDLEESAEYRARPLEKRIQTADAVHIYRVAQFERTMTDYCVKEREFHTTSILRLHPLSRGFGSLIGG